MKEVYEDVQRVNKLDPATPELRFCKLGEEFGELVQAVNKKLGRKVINETEQEILDLILEESADTIQCLMSYVDGIGVNFEDLNGLLSGEWMKKDEIYNFNNHEEYKVPELIMWVEVYKGKLAESGLIKEERTPSFVPNDWVSNSKSSSIVIIRHVMALAGIYGFTPGDVMKKILQKNIKWEKVINKRIENEKS